MHPIRSDRLYRLYNNQNISSSIRFIYNFEKKERKKEAFDTSVVEYERVTRYIKLREIKLKFNLIKFQFMLTYAYCTPILYIN